MTCPSVRILNYTSEPVTAFVANEKVTLAPNQINSFQTPSVNFSYGLRAPQDIPHYSNGRACTKGCFYAVVNHNGKYSIPLYADASDQVCDFADGAIFFATPPSLTQPSLTPDTAVVPFIQK